MPIRCGVTFMPASRHCAANRSIRVASGTAPGGAEPRRPGSPDGRERLMNENYFPRKLLCQAVGRGARPFGARTIMRTAMTLTHRPITLTDQMAMTLTERPLVTPYPDGGEWEGRRRSPLVLTSRVILAVSPYGAFGDQEDRKNTRPCRGPLYRRTSRFHAPPSRCEGVLSALSAPVCENSAANVRGSRLARTGGAI